MIIHNPVQPLDSNMKSIYRNIISVLCDILFLRMLRCIYKSIMDRGSCKETHCVMIFAIIFIYCSVYFICTMPLFVQFAYAARAGNEPIATDSRIKTFVYSANEVFPIVLHYGYQMAIEFGEGEVIQTYSIGNSYILQLSTVGRILFIKPLEDNIMTNMTVITNKRQYYLEIRSKDLMDGSYDAELAYVVRFFYPETDNLKNNKTVMNVNDIVGAASISQSVINANSVKNDSVNITNESNAKATSIHKADIASLKPYNFNYTASGAKTLIPTAIFDDGINTFFQYTKGVSFMPKITIDRGGVDISLDVRKKGRYFVVNTLGSNFIIEHGNKKAIVKAS